MTNKETWLVQAPNHEDCFYGRDTFSSYKEAIDFGVSEYKKYLQGHESIFDEVDPEEFEIGIFWVGQEKEFEPTFDGNFIIETNLGYVYDECGESSGDLYEEDYNEASREDIQELSDSIVEVYKKWADKHMHKVWRIVDNEEIDARDFV